MGSVFVKHIAAARPCDQIVRLIAERSAMNPHKTFGCWL
jgi:hypothetical protein